ncbi:hypothetical protein SUGI_0466000 [Cryptomeria japonica]|uniref:beta-galactosidase 1 n=1 Tax=Cryptomeria japonica TaxID=3369 RepID=UPI0024089552|nr:beta-galactosidase 1 [Cryptomeria japonica]GLJ24399.1 hypothetical protein SUGI_0466000 [Cryptomeria japonica]
MANSEAAIIVGFWLWVCIYMTKGLNAGEVTYDGTSLIVNGTRKLLISGSIHYPRSTPQMWPGLIDKAKEGGLNCVQTYVFWNMHEPEQGKFNFEGRSDLVKFVKLIHSRGMYVSLRIGPYIEAEWNFGGFPYWLREIPGIIFRTDNEPFKREMQRFTEMIANMMKRENLFASQGGPIIVAQIENEYGIVEPSFREGGRSYVRWAANMAIELNTNVPWIMCKQPDAPNPIINTCNGLYCGDTFDGPNSNKKPKMWTENWIGWFQVFGGAKHHRPVENIAYAVARFYAKNGTFVNYYMYHGGTNFGRSGGPFITASYDYDAPIDEYGNEREPKWSHLKDLNTAIMRCSQTLLSARAETFSLGSSQEAHVYRGHSGQCAAFLSNMNPTSGVTLNFQNMTYSLPAWSVSILPDCKTVVFNTANVNAQSKTHNLTSNNPQRKLKSSYFLSNKEVEKGFYWETFKEKIGGSEDTQFDNKGLLEHINTTKDTTDYLWYNIRVDVDENEPFIRSNSSLVLAIGSHGYAVHVFVNDHFSGSAHGNKSNPGFSLNLHISLRPGKNDISLLSVMVGLPDSGAYFERKTAGISSVMIQGFKGGSRDYSQELWAYQIGLVGEKQNIFTKNGSRTVNWNPSISDQHLTWYKTTIDAPEGDGPISLDLRSMGKGQIWINGESVGRYWIIFLVPLGDCSTCDYRGSWNLKKCATNCGQPSQTLYHIPRSLLQPTGNLLVLFEEVGGEPSKISLLTDLKNY